MYLTYNLNILYIIYSFKGISIIIIMNIMYIIQRISTKLGRNERVSETHCSDIKYLYFALQIVIVNKTICMGQLFNSLRYLYSLFSHNTAIK